MHAAVLGPLFALQALITNLLPIVGIHLFPAGFLRNNTPIYTAQGVEVVPFADGCMTEGKLMLHDSCIDKPTTDNFTCEEQRAFGKCDFPFMVVSTALYDLTP
jgi:hypothetical protein